jgi:hypothetical protein
LGTSKPANLTDELAEETLVGLMLTGRSDVFRYAECDASDFENVYFRLIWYALTPMGYASGDQTPEQIVDMLDDCGLIEPAMFAVPLVWYVGLMEKAIGRTHRAMDKENIDLPEAVTVLSLRVKLARANRVDAWREKYCSEQPTVL